ncbi:hypothetical protein B9G69_001840 [Bdellovibrio sp. SKB1291214]|uniref:hypothetical protein n=1 Tax=Bdellovibrio sp. SKB1291214 TaxID=1732569 RepID=UPI000B51B6B0|nr:hypothetical protein [Bdellovibrio sp. SKB1291214]UYL09312.1 hypothetical protein B9G69_001840 [Bdellovibrio sp. SKB1291214]
MKFSTTQWIVFLAGVIGVNSANAASFTLTKGSGYKVEPLYGIETVYRDYPTPHMQTRSMYGLRMSLGVDLLSLEAEYTKASDTEDYSTAPEKVKTDDERLKLGLSSTYRVDFFHMTGRAGAQATKSVRETTSGGIVTKDERPIQYNPYAGASIGVNFGPASINLSSTVVFRDNDWEKSDFQNTISAGIGF